MNEKTKTNLFIISLIAVALWAVSVSIAAGIFFHGRNTARDELTAIREATTDERLQSNLDSISTRNVELERINKDLSDELRTASAVNTKLTGIIDRAARLAESGRQSVQEARQSVDGASGTVNELRNNYHQLANLVITSERNYNAIIGELGKGADVGGADGGTASGE